MAKETTRGRVRWRWIVSRSVPLVALCTLVAGLLALKNLLPVAPPSLRRGLTEGFLRLVQVGYAATLAIALPAALVSGWAVLRSRRRVRSPRFARVFLLAASCLFGLVLAETTAAAWLAWWHRMPALPTRFADTPGDEISLVVFGGSAGMGYPYNPWCSPGQILAWQIERSLPGRKVMLDIRARMGASLEREHKSLIDLKRRPDILILMAGNNEFLARYEGSRDASLDEAPRLSILGPLYRLSLMSPLCRLVYETVSKNRLGGPPPPIVHPRLIGPPAVTPSEYATLIDDFRRRLDALVSWCQAIGTIPVLVIPPGNESGFEPNRSVLSATLSAAEREALTREFETAKAAESAAPNDAVARYRSLVARQPNFAEAHLRLARLLGRDHQRDDALRHYLLARDLDGFPVRVNSDFQRAFRDVASRRGCILIDGPEVARASSPSGIVGDHLIHDAHHPTLLGQVALSEAILGALRERKRLGLAPSDVRIDPAECVRHFGIDREAWSAVCARSSTFYRDFAVGRYDPSERLEKMRRFAEAGERIAAGIAPEATGVPGLGIPGADRTSP